MSTMKSGRKLRGLSIKSNRTVSRSQSSLAASSKQLESPKSVEYVVLECLLEELTRLQSEISSWVDSKDSLDLRTYRAMNYISKVIGMVSALAMARMPSLSSLKESGVVSVSQVTSDI